MVNALVIVAHPDDEIIWMGGYLLRYSDWDWTIVSLCRKNDMDREPRFRNVCKMLNAESHISDLDDTEEGYFKRISNEDIEPRLNFLFGKRFDYVFTHGSNGEYGHIRHRQVSNSVKKMIKERKLMCRKLFLFSYQKKGKFCFANLKADKYINLDENELREKKNLIKNVYGFQDGGFEETCAAGSEAFSIEELK